MEVRVALSLDKFVRAQQKSSKEAAGRKRSHATPGIMPALRRTGDVRPGRKERSVIFQSTGSSSLHEVSTEKW